MAYEPKHVRPDGDSQPRRSATGEGQPRRAPAGEGQPRRAPTGEGQPRRAPAGEGQPRRAPTGEGQPRRTPTGEGQPRRTPTGEGQPRRAPTGEGQPRRAPTGEGQPRRTPTGEGQPRRAPTGEGQPRRTSAGDGQPRRTPSGQSRRPQETGRQPARSGASRKRRRRRNNLRLILTAAAFLLLVILGIFCIVKLAGAIFGGETPAEPTVPPTEATEPQPETVVSTVTVGAMGDLLMHGPIFMESYNALAYKGGGVYDFSSIFRYVAPYLQKTDWAVANLETTLAGEARPYSGYPAFNCPDQLVTDARGAGFDMLLTSNNHCFDTAMDGYLRTLNTVRNAGLQTLGTMATADEPSYYIANIKGIRLGMISYTYETGNGSNDVPSLNGTPMSGGSYSMINTFSPYNVEPFFPKIQEQIAQMKADGAEAIILFIHWGDEYATKPNDLQTSMAQRLCDMGVDVIIGGHPHVVEPMALLQSSTDPRHRTVCIYSLGNAVSNQRTGGSKEFPGSYIEDGVLFTVTFEKYSDGTVYLAGTDAIPTWVKLSTETKREYNILPLVWDEKEQWAETFELGPIGLGAAEKSYDRTMELIGQGLTDCQQWLEEMKKSREEYYYNLAWHPEMFAEETIPAETLPDAA